MVSPVAKKQLDQIHKDKKQKIIDTIQQLQADPLTSRPKVDIKKLIDIKDNIDLYRLRASNYGIMYEISDNTI